MKSNSHQSTETACKLLVLVLAALVGAIAGCGGGGSDSTPSTIYDGFGPGSPSTCSKSTAADVWLNNRLGCLAAGQKFSRASGASGALADRAYIVGQQAHDTALANILGANRLRYFKYAICVKNAPENLAPNTLTVDLEIALGLNLLANGSGFYPPGISGSAILYGGIADANVLQVPCSAATHPIIVNYTSGKLESVNPSAMSAVQVFDR
jgi:hypothetical protein